MRRHFGFVPALLLSIVVFAQLAAAQTATSQLALPQVTVRASFDAFDVATVKLADSGPKSGQYIAMQGTNRFVAKAYTLKMLIAAAYSLNPKTVSGGPGWIESDTFDIVALSPGDVRPSHEEQMKMLQALLSERFALRFHRATKELSIYALQVASGGTKLKQSAVATDAPAIVGPAILYQGTSRVRLPVRNATLGDFTTLMQRAILDRPVVDRTELAGKYDFDLEWAADDSQFGGGLPANPPDAVSAPLFTAIQEQLGLRLVATRGEVQALVVDAAERPTAN